MFVKVVGMLKVVGTIVCFSGASLGRLWADSGKI